MLNNSTLLGFCLTFASVFDPFLSIANSFFVLLGLALPTVSSVCTTIFGPG